MTNLTPQEYLDLERLHELITIPCIEVRTSQASVAMLIGMLICANIFLVFRKVEK